VVLEAIGVSASGYLYQRMKPKWDERLIDLKGQASNLNLQLEDLIEERRKLRALAESELEDVVWRLSR
jgi:hypothetical protein